MTYFLTVDPAFKPSRYSDYTAVLVCGYKKKDPWVYVAEAVRLKGQPDDLLKLLYNLYSEYNYKVAGMEDGAWQTTMDWALKYAAKQRGLPPLPIKGIKMSLQTDAKDKRIRALSYFFKHNLVILKKGLDDLKKELVRYPAGARSKDDLVDALAMQPKLLLLDEPAAGLTPAEVKKLSDKICQLKEQGITILVVEHHMGMVMDIADEVAALHNGEIIVEGSPDAVKNDPRVIEAYLRGRRRDA